MITKQTIYFTMVHHPTRGKIRARELRKCQAAYRRMVIYIAGRFRAKDGWQIHENVHAAERAGRAVAALGAMPLVPHSIGAHMADTESDDFWLTGTLELMRRCDAVLVLPGYQESQGTMGEIAEAQRIGMPVIMPLDGAPNWEELRSRLKKPKVTGETAMRTTEDIIKELLESLGVPPERMHETPRRYAKALRDMTAGYRGDVHDVLSTRLAGSCPFCASRISVVERDGVFVARCSHRGCGARGPKHHDLTRACDLFCCPPQRTAGGMGGPDVGGAL